MKTCFMVAEKPSLALSLAKILSNNKLTSRKGSNSACSVHEFVTRFPPTNETVRFKFTSVCGHVMSLDFTAQYNNWDKVDPVSYKPQNIFCLNIRCNRLNAIVCTVVSLRLFCFQAELFTAKTVKKEATEKLHMPNYLEREVRIEVSFMVSI